MKINFRFARNCFFKKTTLIYVLLASSIILFLTYKTLKANLVKYYRQKKIAYELSKKIQTQVHELPLCPEIPQNLIGELSLNLTHLTEDQISEALVKQGIELGGFWRPKNCKARHHIAILLPFRNREWQLNSFLLNMHPMLSRQQLSYGIYVIEAVQNVSFNRGLLFNVGFIESNKDSNWTCHSYHDVDLLPENDHIFYFCPKVPTHLAYRIKKFRYKPFYEDYFGGATILDRRHFEISNGYSNQYFGWGSEDDDHSRRLRAMNFTIRHINDTFAKYTMISHAQEYMNPERFQLIDHASKRFKTDGLNSVLYKIKEVTRKPLYTRYLVHYDRNETKAQLEQY